jgi:endonuclease YncB( thermonuclease family)
MVISFNPPPRRWRFVPLVLLAGLGLLGGISQANESAEAITGPMRVIDGDSFEVAGVKIRLHAVDAPETDQMCETRQGTEWACGGWISKVVTDRYSGQPASCDALDTDRYGRTVARCTALGGDMGAWLVSEGLAFAYVKYGSDYVALERAAAAVDRGLHALRMQSPEQHRRDRSAAPQRASGDCAIKGNISAKGTKIYHMPGQEFYSRTRINEAKGERWFCSEAAARAAGWRKARR